MMVYCMQLGHFLSSLATFISGVIIATISCWEVSLLTLLVGPLILVIGATYTKKMNSISSLKMGFQSQATSLIYIGQSISQIRAVYAFVGERSSIETFSGYCGKLVFISKKEALVKGVGIGIFQTVTFCSWALMVWIGAIVVFVPGLGCSSLTYAAPDIQVFNEAKAAGNEVFQVIQRKPTATESSEERKMEHIDGNIDIFEVHFAYPSRPEKFILQGFSLSIAAGKTIALVGSSGSGKSTIISLLSRFYHPLQGSRVALVGPSGAGKSSVLALLLRFYDPEEGNILIDGKNIKEYNLRMLRMQIGFVQQEPLLFSSSIRYNICYGNEQASETELLEVSRVANIHEFVSTLPHGYDTLVGEKGCQLSGGQKQRLAIARTLLKKPAILLLDEPTSALDAQSERTLVSALESIKKKNGLKTTQITVAHRLSTVTNSDIIIVMDKGEIVEIGSHTTLLTSSDGVYSKFFKIQSLGDD